MQHDDLVYVGQMFDLGRKIDDRARSLDRAGFDADENVRLALTHLIQTLGEAAVGSLRGSNRRIRRFPGPRSSECDTRSCTTT